MMRESMPDVTQILHAIDSGDAEAASELLPLVYAELRKLAEHRMKAESPDHTLEATALVHEAYIRLVGKNDPGRQNRGHFFAAARRSNAPNPRRPRPRKTRRQKRRRLAAHLSRRRRPQALGAPDELLLLDETLHELAKQDPLCGKLVELRYFAGLTVEEAAATLGISPATGYRHWSFARAWLYAQMGLARQSPEK